MDHATDDLVAASASCRCHDEPHRPMRMRTLTDDWCLVQELSASGLHSRIWLSRGEATRELLVCADGDVPVDPEEWWFDAAEAMSFAAHVTWHVVNNVEPGTCDRLDGVY